jgi:hypothetical protein
MDQATLTRLRQQDRTELTTLLTALNGAMNAIRRDECGDWTIFGSRGTIRACDGTFYVYIQCRSARAWNAAKKQLAKSCPVISQDGDEEGILILSETPDQDEAETLRRYIGLRQTRDVSPDRIQNIQNPRL